MQTLDSETVRNIAELARLSFGPAESEKLAVELTRLLTAFESLPPLALDTAEPAPTQSRSRADVALPALQTEAFLAQAPDRDGSYVRVPAILGGS